MASTSKKSWIKITSWEFWPMPLVYFPIYIYCLFLSLRARSFRFFSASNPAIENSGMFGESKSAILNKVPAEYRPAMVVVPLNMEWMIALVKIRSAGIRFPFIVKPDIGVNGNGVKRIHHEEEFKAYLEKSPCTVIAQELIEWPEEYGVFYIRIPGEEKGRVTSLVKKSFLSVIGDGTSTVEQLMEQNPRAVLQIERFRKEYAHKLEMVPAIAEVKILEPIGTRSKGTTYLNANHLINGGMNETFDSIAKKIDGFYYGRFDVRCRTEEDVVTGQQMRILELNGAGAEPAHIYDPESSIFSAWASLFYHWHLLYKVSVTNHRKGIPYLTKEEVKRYQDLNKKVKKHWES
jgi:hypothetical protein